MNKEKFIIIILLVFSAFVINHQTSWVRDIKASILPNHEKEFSKSVDVIWQGEIISIMANGSCIGLKGEFDNYIWAVACLNDIDSKELWKFQGMVTVTGKWLGITCAYRNTIFGECVPDIRIESII